MSLIGFKQLFKIEKKTFSVLPNYFKQLIVIQMSEYQFLYSTVEILYFCMHVKYNKLYNMQFRGANFNKGSAAARQPSFSRRKQ